MINAVANAPASGTTPNQKPPVMPPSSGFSHSLPPTPTPAGTPFDNTAAESHPVAEQNLQASHAVKPPTMQASTNSSAAPHFPPGMRPHHAGGTGAVHAILQNPNTNPDESATESSADTTSQVSANETTPPATTSASATPSNDSPPSSPKRGINFSPKMIVGVLIMALIIIGGGAGFYLTQQQQDTRSDASGCTGSTSQSCTANSNCYWNGSSCNQKIPSGQGGCCSSNNDCPNGQSCTISNGACQSNNSCDPNSGGGGGNPTPPPGGGGGGGSVCTPGSCKSDTERCWSDGTLACVKCNSNGDGWESSVQGTGRACNPNNAENGQSCTAAGIIDTSQDAEYCRLQGGQVSSNDPHNCGATGGVACAKDGGIACAYADPRQPGCGTIGGGWPGSDGLNNISWSGRTLANNSGSPINITVCRGPDNDSNPGCPISNNCSSVSVPNGGSYTMSGCEQVDSASGQFNGQCIDTDCDTPTQRRSAPQAITLSGRVYCAETGKGYANQTIQLSKFVNGQLPNPLPSVITDAEGRFSFTATTAENDMAIRLLRPRSGFTPLGTFNNFNTNAIGASSLCKITNKDIDTFFSYEQCTFPEGTTDNLDFVFTQCGAEHQFPEGHHDQNVCTFENNIQRRTVRGWACDPDHFQTKVTVHFWLGTAQETFSDGFLGGVIANNPAEDADAISQRCGNTDGNRRFEFTIPNQTSNGRTVQDGDYIWAFAINIDSSGNPSHLNGRPDEAMNWLLTSSPKVISGCAPTPTPTPVPGPQCLSITPVNPSNPNQTVNLQNGSLKPGDSVAFRCAHEPANHPSAVQYEFRITPSGGNAQSLTSPTKGNVSLPFTLTANTFTAQCRICVNSQCQPWE